MVVSSTGASAPAGGLAAAGSGSSPAGGAAALVPADVAATAGSSAGLASPSSGSVWSRIDSLSSATAPFSLAAPVRKCYHST